LDWDWDWDWDWEYISMNPNITWEIIQCKNAPWDWEAIAENPNITWEIIRNNHFEEWHSRYVSRNPNITWEIINSNPKYPWYWCEIYQNYNAIMGVPTSILESICDYTSNEKEDIIAPGNIHEKNLHLTQDTIENNLDKVNWNFISNHKFEKHSPNWKEEKIQWYHHWIYEGFRKIEEHLSRNDKFCVGNEISLADITLIPQIFSAKEYKCSLKQYPNITKVYKNCLKIEEFKKAEKIFRKGF